MSNSFIPGYACLTQYDSIQFQPNPPAGGSQSITYGTGEKDGIARITMQNQAKPKSKKTLKVDAKDFRAWADPANLGKAAEVLEEIMLYEYDKMSPEAKEKFDEVMQYCGL
ncbi:MAG: hypothetical protein EBU90_26830 [Proteobacteria bacterium]|nr:hypothetical protein [Pseudomonadota bacterium]